MAGTRVERQLGTSNSPGEQSIVGHRVQHVDRSVRNQGRCSDVLDEVAC